MENGWMEALQSAAKKHLFKKKRINLLKKPIIFIAMVDCFDFSQFVVFCYFRIIPYRLGILAQRQTSIFGSPD
jgi:hypothetical protein